MAEITIHEADCVRWLRAYDGPLLDAVVSDPPYELGFMGKAWDSTGVAFQPDTWRAVWERMKPGAHLVAFSGTRTYHRMACAIEDAGFEIRDQLAWCYGSGFPKSLDVSKAIDKAAGAVREVTPASPMATGTEVGAISRNLRCDECGKARASGDPCKCPRDSGPATPDALAWQGWGTALKPAWEPICLARKPLGEATVAANVLRYGTGGLNVDGCRVGETKRVPGSAKTGPASTHTVSLPGYGGGTGHDPNVGRFPANLLHDGSPEVLAGFPDTSSHGDMGGQRSLERTEVFGTFTESERVTRQDAGSAARFFYSAKAGPLDRIGTDHATVKPVDVMRWLVRLVTPPGGLICDPFAGSGTTGIAAMAEGVDCHLIELDPHHASEIRRKIAHLQGREGGARIAEHVRAKRTKTVDELPLFGG